MKALFFVFIPAVIILSACSNSLESDAIKDFIPGTYIRFSQQEFGTMYDTVIISVQNKYANEYLVLSKWKYERILDGRPIEPEYKIVKTAGIYDQERRLLRDQSTGNYYSFEIKQKLMFNGANKFKKIK